MQKRLILWFLWAGLSTRGSAPLQLTCWRRSEGRNGFDETALYQYRFPTQASVERSILDFFNFQDLWR